MPEHRMYGLWDSPITGKTLATSLRLSEPCWDTDGRTLAWVEGRSDRGVLVVQDANGGATRDLTTDLSVRAFVGYGGGDFTLSHGVAYFVAQHDQRIYRQELTGGRARPITPAFGASSTPTVSPDGRWLAYVHTYEDIDCIAIVDTEGKHWPARLAEGRDFSMQPAWSGDGRRLAWVEWDHPSMPWDGTELRVAEIAYPEGALPVIAASRIVAGGAETAVSQPVFAKDGTLVYASDATGFGHLYRHDLATGASTRLTDGPGEFTFPAWNQGMRRIAITPGGAIVGVRGEAGFDALTVLRNGVAEDLRERHAGYTVLSHPVASPASEQVAVVAEGSQQPPRVVVVDLATNAPAPDVRRRSDAETIRREDLAPAEAISWTSFDGETAHGLYYAPTNSRFQGDGAPPLIVLIHGGPTSQSTAQWSPQTQFFTSRGYAVLRPNYRGSTGYGREYMLKLRRSWGIYDVQDARTGAEELVRRGLADGSRLVIMGGSAGGFTVLQSLVEFQGFYKAGLSLFGVANQFLLAADTHKFEARYLDSLLGPLPEAAAIYRERSPYFHARRIKDPLAIFQGEIDRVVPRNQSDEIVAALRANGVPHVYHVYEGEGHGWRKSETIEKFYGHVEAFLKQYVLYG